MLSNYCLLSSLQTALSKLPSYCALDNPASYLSRMGSEQFGVKWDLLVLWLAALADATGD